jgi:hypothetical protein
MATISVGYDGVINETQWADMIKKVGASDYGVVDVNDWKVTAVTGADRTVSIAAGKGWGHGIFDEITANITIQLDTVSSGSRWDLIVMRRNWTGAGGLSTITKVNGTTSKEIPGTRAVGPGVIDEQPLALVQVTAGQTQPTAIVDLRCWAGNGGLVAKDDLAKNYLNKPGAELRIGQIVWRYVLGANDIPVWEAELSPGYYAAIDSGNYYSYDGGFWVEQVGTKRRVTVDMTVTRTAASGTIPTTFASFGVVVPSAARGVAPHKYFPGYVSGGNLANNVEVGLFINPFTGEMMIRGIRSSFTLSTGARFTVNLVYYI